MKARRDILLVIVLLILSILACNLPGSNSGGGDSGGNVPPAQVSPEVTYVVVVENTSTPSPTETPVPATATPQIPPELTLTKNSNCRVGPSTFYNIVDQIAADLQQTLAGNETRALYNEGGPVPITRRLEVAVLGTFRSTYGPTPTHRRAVEIADAEFAGVKERIGRINDRELPDLRRELDAAGVPWTPGRGVPGRN